MCQIYALRSVARSLIPLSTQVSPLTLYCRWRGKSRPSLIARYKHDAWHAGACIHSTFVESPAHSRLFSLPNGPFKSKLFTLAPSFLHVLIASNFLTWFIVVTHREITDRRPKVDRDRGENCLWRGKGHHEKENTTHTCLSVYIHKKVNVCALTNKQTFQDNKYIHFLWIFCLMIAAAAAAGGRL